VGDLELGLVDQELEIVVYQPDPVGIPCSRSRIWHTTVITKKEEE
jgi:hypothetical protein